MVNIPIDYFLLQDYLRVLDVTFIPTHVVVLMADGSVILHSSSAKLRGLAIVDRAKKFRSGAIVTRRWCSRTSTPKVCNSAFRNLSS